MDGNGCTPSFLRLFAEVLSSVEVLGAFFIFLRGVPFPPIRTCSWSFANFSLLMTELVMDVYLLFYFMPQEWTNWIWTRETTFWLQLGYAIQGYSHRLCCCLLLSTQSLHDLQIKKDTNLSCGEKLPWLDSMLRFALMAGSLSFMASRSAISCCLTSKLQGASGVPNSV